MEFLVGIVVGLFIGVLSGFIAGMRVRRIDLEECEERYSRLIESRDRAERALQAIRTQVPEQTGFREEDFDPEAYVLPDQTPSQPYLH